MNFLANALVSLLELLEAEGRCLRKNALRVGSAVIVYAVAGAFLIAGMLLILAGLHAILAMRYGVTAAHFIAGALALALAAVVFAVGTRVARGQDAAEKVGGDEDNGDEREKTGDVAG